MTTARESNAGDAAAERVSQSSSARSEQTGVSLLAEEAARVDVDECDVCLEAMPGYVLGDLRTPDATWVLQHVSECDYCRNELGCFERIDGLLDDCCPEESARPPMVALARAVQLPTASWGRIESPIGELLIAVSGSGVCEIGFGWIESEAEFAQRLMRRGYLPARDQQAIAGVVDQLGEYFAGRRNRFAVPLDLSGVTPFTRQVLDATYTVPFGQVRTYAEIARAIGHPKASRAVGNALHNNPLPLIVPCHRIVPTGGGIGNYAGTPGVKERLLSLEGAISGSQRSAIAP